MNYLLPGLVTLGFTTIMFVLMSKAVYVELRERVGTEKPGRKN